MNISIRLFQDSDAKILRDITVNSDQTYMHHPKDESYTVDDALRYIRDTRIGDIRAFAVCVDDEIVGNIYVDISHDATIGCYLHRDFVGKGVGTRATLLMIDLCFDKIGVDVVRAYVVGDNIVSIHVLEGIGFEVEKVMHDLPHDSGNIDLYVLALKKEKYKNKEQK